MREHHSSDRPPDKRRGPDIAKASGAERSEAGNLKTDSSTIALFSSDPWRIPMIRARAIGRYRPGALKFASVRRWRVSVQTALGQEVTP